MKRTPPPLIPIQVDVVVPPVAEGRSHAAPADPSGIHQGKHPNAASAKTGRTEIRHESGQVNAPRQSNKPMERSRQSRSHPANPSK